MPAKARISRKWLIAAWIGAGVIVAAYYALWRYAAGEMETAVNDWVAEQRAAGLYVDHGAIKRDGFPFFLRVQIAAPHIEQPGVFSWRAEALSLDALPHDLNRLIFSPSGAQSFVAEGYGAWTYAAESIRASIAADKQREWIFSMNIERATADETGGASSSLESLVFDLTPAIGDPTTLTLNLVGRGYEVRAGQKTVAVDGLEMSLSLSDVDALGQSGAAADWRNAGGALTVHGLNALIDETSLSAHGSMSLDELSLPAGTMTTTLEKPAGLVAALANGGALTQEEADAATAGLALVAMAQGGRIEAPIELHAGAVTIAGVKVADLTPIE